VQASLDTEEKVLYERRRHILYLVVGVGVVLGVGYVSFLLFKSKFIFVGAGLAIWYVFMDWKRNVWYITNKRLIEEEGVFTKNVKETPLEKINNVTYQKDPLGMIFNYGTVYVESAAKDGMTMMKLMPNPEAFLRKISEAKNAFLSSNLMECPFCKEIIKKGAIRCRFCGADLGELEERIEEERIEKIDKSVEEKKEVEKIKKEEDETPAEGGGIYKRRVDINLFLKEDKYES
jgi:membrane protein YdbS with pleckstrin-like domain